MNFLIQDIRFGLRALLKSPGFTAIAVVTLALGIGANAAIFSVLNALLFRPLPMVENPEDIVILANRDKHMEFPHGLSYVDYLDYRQQNDVFEELAIYTPSPVGISGQGLTERTWGLFISGDYFDVFGTNALHGAPLKFDDTAPTGGEPVLVLGHTFWQRNLGGRPSVVGETLELNGVAFTVAGIMPEGFNGNESIFDIDVFAPLTTLEMVSPAYSGSLEDRESHIFRTVARLSDGKSIKEAKTSMQLLADRLGEQYPDTNADVELIVDFERNARPEPSSYGLMQPIAMAFMGLVSLVLFIACANVANLLLARGTSRKREIATRTALGASRGRIIRQLLTETLLLALLGGAVGILIAEWAGAFVSTMANNLPVDIPINFDFRPDIRVYGFALIAAIVSCVVAGLVPAFHATRLNLTEALKEGRTSSAGSGRHRMRKTLVVSQLAVSLLLLVIAGLFVQSLSNARQMDLGFQQGNLLLMSVDPGSHGYDVNQSRQLLDEIVMNVQGLPGVESAGLGGFLPFSGSGLQAANILAVGGERLEASEAPTVFYNSVDYLYFRTMGIPILAGRGFNELDTADSSIVVVINEIMAAQIWPDDDPVGKTFYVDDLEGDLCEVVGVVPSGKYMLVGEDPRAFMYRPLTQSFPPFQVILHVRSEGDPMSMATTVRGVIESIDGTLPIFEVKDIATHLRDGNALMPYRMGAMIVGCFGTLGIVLAVIGIYGVISYSVTSRTHEFGVRVAIGASAGEVLMLVLREGFWLAGMGAVIGLVITALLAPVMQTMLLNVNPLNGALYGAVTVFLIIVALVACVIPARRATKVDPMVALRYE